MLVPQVRLNSALSWGLGWGLASYAGQETFWHWGKTACLKTSPWGIHLKARVWSS
jgi:hypothetical protein